MSLKEINLFEIEGITTQQALKLMNQIYKGEFEEMLRNLPKKTILSQDFLLESQSGA